MIPFEIQKSKSISNIIIIIVSYISCLKYYIILTCFWKKKMLKFCWLHFFHCVICCFFVFFIQVFVLSETSTNVCWKICWVYCSKVYFNYYFKMLFYVKPYFINVFCQLFLFHLLLFLLLLWYETKGNFEKWNLDWN